MADSRPSGLQNEVLATELAALYDTLIIPIDDPSYSPNDIKKIKVKTLLQTINDAISTINTALGNKADESNVLQLNNTDEYTPTENYHPATKKIVDDIGFKIISRALIDSAGGVTGQKGITISCNRDGTGQYTITHNIGHTNYHVIANSTYTADRMVKVGAIVRSNNSFALYTGDDDSFDNGSFEFIIIEFNTNFSF